MKFAGECTVPAPREAVFARLNDPVFFASCLEGVHDLAEVDPTHYTAVLETRIAYLKFRFAVSVEFVTVEPPHTIVARGEGTPHGIVGRLTSIAAARLSEAGEETVVAYEIDLALTGKLGSIGQPVLKAKAKEMERHFVKNLNTAFAPSGAVQ